MTDANTLLRQADRCVKCGLCLPHCPTYAKTGDENESPRGRIALMQGLVQGALKADARLIAHLDHCLACRACEAVCPSQVAYGELLDETRILLENLRPPRTLKQDLGRRLGFALLRHRPALRLGRWLLRMYQRSGAQTWLGRRERFRHRFPGLARLNRMLPAVPAGMHWQAYYPPQTAVRGIVTLFLGCVSDALDTPTLQASIRMLNRIGYGVAVPRRQGCCGALHWHNGEPQAALALARRNIRALLGEDIHAVVYTATGCGAQLAEYAALPWPNATERAQAERLAGRVREIGAFLNEQDWPAELKPAPLSARIAVHTPCSQVNVLHQGSASAELLARIPGLDITPLADNRRCCGAAGSYMLSEPAMADNLREDKLRAIAASGATLLATTNIGCALHLEAGLRQQQEAPPASAQTAKTAGVEIVHPVVLLDRQCRLAEAAD